MNYGVFSKHLLERFNWVKSPTNNRDLFCEGQLHLIIPYDDEIDSGVFVCSSYPNDQIAKQIQYKIWYNEDLQKVLKWVVNNIVRKITKDSHNTICVKIRVATSMLNCLLLTKQLAIEENIRIHDNMVQNLLDLKRDSMEENLPF